MCRCTSVLKHLPSSQEALGLDTKKEKSERKNKRSDVKRSDAKKTDRAERCPLSISIHSKELLKCCIYQIRCLCF